MSITQSNTRNSFVLTFNDPKYFEFESYYKESTTAQDWYRAEDDDYLHVGESGNRVYKTVIKIKNSYFNQVKSRILNARLILPISEDRDVYEGYWFYVYIVDDCNQVAFDDYVDCGKRADKTVSIDFTDSQTQSYSDVTVDISPSDDVYYKFKKDVSIEIEYLDDENVKLIKKEIDIAGVATAEFDACNMDVVTTFCDVSPQDTPMGIGIYHTYLRSLEDNLVGNSFRLNVNEKFKKHSDKHYIYTDGRGIIHPFRECFYYMDDNVKTYITDKTLVEVDSKGDLSYTLDDKRYKTVCEYKSDTGLRAITELSGVKYLKLYEQRTEEQIQVDTKLEQYINELNTFVIYNKSTATKIAGYELKNKLTTRDGAVDFINKAESSTSYIVLHDGETDTSFNYLETVKNYIKEYFALLEEKELLKIQTPINFLTDESIIKGYNKDGDLVVIYDKRENYAIIEYEKYFVGDGTKYRIARIYDNFEKQITFDYDDLNHLTSITDTKGRKTYFSYNENNYLYYISSGERKKIALGYDYYKNLDYVKNVKTGVKAEYFSSGTRLDNICHYSTLNNIGKYGTIECDEFISTVGITYEPGFKFSPSVRIDDAQTSEVFDFDEDGNCLAYTRARNGIVVQSEKYEYTPYWIGEQRQENPKLIIKRTPETMLNWFYLDEFTFDEYDTETIYFNQFGKIVRKETTPIRISYIDESVNENNIIEKYTFLTTTVEYSYNEDKKPIEEKVTKSYSSNIERTILDEFTVEQIELKTEVFNTVYHYNNFGEVVRKESWVNGEESTNGKTVQDTVYDKIGNIVKTFTYNTLDTSSKLCTEKAYSVDGKMVAEFDATGESAVEYNYVDGTDMVREEKLPNGSKYAYGRDLDGIVTSITHSTKDGEENSTQKICKYGKVVEARSGNNTVQYTYDSNREVKKVDLNGQTNYVTYSREEQKEYGKVTKKTITKTDKNGDVIVTELNGLGQVLSVKVNGVFQVENTYNRAGNISEKVINDGASYSYVYDDHGKLLEVSRKNAFGYIERNSCGETYKYDEYDNVTSRKLNGRVTHEYSYAYKTDSTGALEEVIVNGYSVKPQTDVLGRNTGKKIVINDTMLAEEQISYKKIGDHATNMPVSLKFGNYKNDTYVVSDSIKYTYDNMGNVNKIYENGKLVVRYTYDALNRLIREDNLPLDKTVLIMYDNYGNIIKQKTFAFSLKDEELLEENSSTDKDYIYDGDKLVSFNGQACEYDEVGNPTTYRGKPAYWCYDRRFDGYDDNFHNYDGAGDRTTNSGVELTYDVNGNLVRTSDGLEFFYDHTGISSVKHNGIIYFYRKDIFGNIIALIDNILGEVAVKYIYDAWGNHKVVDGSGNEITSATHIGNLNPFRYRSYFYDTGAKFYYLKSRDYDPETGRFLTIDSIEYIDPNSINGLNLYAYCANNPVMNIDPSGNAWYNVAWDWVNTIAGFLDPKNTILAIATVIVATIDGRFGEIVEDFKNGCLNPFNQSEEVALKSSVLSFYKGSTVVKQDIIGTCSALGTIWADSSMDIIDLQHEYGHSIQERILGEELYFSRVAIPSVLHYHLGDNSPSVYYSMPWERTADLLGGVSRGNYKRGALAWGVAENIFGLITIPFYYWMGY